MLLPLWLAAAAAVADDDPEAIPADARVGRVVLARDNVFDLSDPETDGTFYRFFNHFHIVTREGTIEKQLLFAPGERFDPRLLEESERVLRRNKYFFDAAITPALNDAGEVDVTVNTRDVWTLVPEVQLTRSGGENTTVLGVEESNLFGYGHRVLLTWSENVDRRSTAFEYSNPQIGTSWFRTRLRVADNSDGDTLLFNLVKPFHVLDARRAGGFTVFENDRRQALYNLGEEAAEYRQDRRRFSAFAGLSKGLTGGWVRRWTAGVVYDDNDFSDVPEPILPQAIPADRRLVYPFLGVELLEDRFQKSANRNQMERSEDFYMGTRLSATLGWSDTSFDADRDALVYSLSGNLGFGTLDKRALLLSAVASGRHEDEGAANATLSVDARYYSSNTDKQLFFAVLNATVGDNLDLDNPLEIGGDTGLRGYPLRYQSGDSRLLLTLEQRYFTDWYPFSLFRVGGAVFLDTGRVWGRDPLGGPNLGWLTDLGFGFRFAPTRLGTRKIVHLDIAFPLDGDPTIDSVQVLLELKQSF